MALLAEQLNNRCVEKNTFFTHVIDIHAQLPSTKLYDTARSQIDAMRADGSVHVAAHVRMSQGIGQSSATVCNTLYGHSFALIVYVVVEGAIDRLEYRH